MNPYPCAIVEQETNTHGRETWPYKNTAPLNTKGRCRKNPTARRESRTGANWKRLGRPSNPKTVNCLLEKTLHHPPIAASNQSQAATHCLLPQQPYEHTKGAFLPEALGGLRGERPREGVMEGEPEANGVGSPFASSETEVRGRLPPPYLFKPILAANSLKTVTIHR